MRIPLNSPDLASGLQGTAKTSRFLGEVVDWDGSREILSLGAAAALVIIALGLIMWLTPRKHGGNGEETKTS